MYIVKATHWAHMGSGGTTNTITLITQDFRLALSVARNIEKDKKLDFGDENGNCRVFIYDLAPDVRYVETDFNWYPDRDEMPQGVVVYFHHGSNGKWREQWSELSIQKPHHFKEFSDSLRELPDHGLESMLRYNENGLWKMSEKVYDAVSQELAARKKIKSLTF